MDSIRESFGFVRSAGQSDRFSHNAYRLDRVDESRSGGKFSANMTAHIRQEQGHVGDCGAAIVFGHGSLCCASSSCATAKDVTVIKYDLIDGCQIILETAACTILHKRISRNMHQP